MTTREITLFILWCWLKETKRRERVRARSARRAADPKQRMKLDACRAAHESRPDIKVKKAAANAAWWESNPGKEAQYQKTYAKRHPDRIKANWKNFSKTHPRYTSERARKMPQVRLTRNLRKRVWDAVQGTTKSAKTAELVGCSAEYLMQHLQRQFKPGMTWENYGLGGWHVDHKKPCAAFDLTDPVQQRECFHYTNLQPLWELENFQKNKKC